MYMDETHTLTVVRSQIYNFYHQVFYINFGTENSKFLLN
jgi:hypothetical protein